MAAARATLGHAQAMGIEWSLDDFGTGYSSLSQLHGLQIDTVKIDRSFVSRMGVERHGSEMVRAIVALAHTLDMDVVAEGVETPEHATRLPPAAAIRPAHDVWRSRGSVSCVVGPSPSFGTVRVLAGRRKRETRNSTRLRRAM
jgi:hypothetical protein